MSPMKELEIEEIERPGTREVLESRVERLMASYIAHEESWIRNYSERGDCGRDF